MKRVLLTISYDGSRYSGWQKQAGRKTIQGEIEKALKIVSGQDIEVFGSGRTDAGVHALGATAHFDLPVNIPISRLADVLNNLLPGDICIKKAQQVAPDFHARFASKRKTYVYNVCTGKKDAFKSNYQAYITDNLDYDKMQKAASILTGKHNFEGFCSSATAVRDFEREIFSITIQKKANNVVFTVVGNGFLYNMVRIIVGTIIDVGRGRVTLEATKKALKTGDRTLVGVTMPPNGLYLKKVEYI